MTRIDRRALFTSGAAAALLAATGVSATPTRGGTLRAALSGASRTDIWAQAPQGLMMQAAAAAVHEGLTEIAADGTVRGLLAERWDSPDGGLTWHFQLRPGVTFHDGTPFDPAHAMPALRSLGHARTGGARISLVLDVPNPSLPYALADPAYLVRAPHDPQIGTGLYTLEELSPGRRVRLNRVASHWRDRQAGWFDQIDLQHFDDQTVRAQALIEGLVDVADVNALPDMRGFQPLPDAGRVLQVAQQALAHPAQIGRVWPLDNLRGLERWWRA